ncbi:MAG: hypothetical protein OER91_05040 [Gammaproteobacteria bacterium]|nr:hypothetical protein [Gammaproteobacteria bacterium]
MLSTTAGKPARLSDTQEITRKTGNVATRKIWLPKLLYDSLPYFYLVSGFLAFFATLYISEWFWVLPHYLLFSAACIHLGVLIYRRRRRAASDA